jgi:hypothetical protein
LSLSSSAWLTDVLIVCNDLPFSFISNRFRLPRAFSSVCNHAERGGRKCGSLHSKEVVSFPSFNPLSLSGDIRVVFCVIVVGFF